MWSTSKVLNFFCHLQRSDRSLLAIFLTTAACIHWIETKNDKWFLHTCPNTIKQLRLWYADFGLISPYSEKIQFCNSIHRIAFTHLLELGHIEITAPMKIQKTSESKWIHNHLVHTIYPELIDLVCFVHLRSDALRFRLYKKSRRTEGQYIFGCDTPKMDENQNK